MGEKTSTKGFFLLDTVVALLVASVISMSILTLVRNASYSALKLNTAIHQSISRRNKDAVEFF